MRAFVFTDKALESEAGRFVWLDMNTDLAKNVAFRTQYKVLALPTYYIVDPDSEKVLLARVGGATVPQLLGILDSGRNSYLARTNPESLSPADRALARADEAYGAADYEAAAAGYRGTLASAPADWPAYERTIEACLFALQQSDQNAEAAAVARDAYPRLKRSGAAANLAVTGLDCALALPPETPGRAELVAAMEAAAREVAGDLSLPVAADDRSSVFISLLSALEERGDSTAAREVAGDWASFLEGEAGRATTPEARAVFDPHRMSAYFELDEPARAIPMLTASERDLPDDYNPPARLAATYARMKEWKEAVAATDRALAKAYGPRKLRIYQTRADAQSAMGDTAAALGTLREALALAESLPEGQRSPRAIDALKEKIAALGPR